MKPPFDKFKPLTGKIPSDTPSYFIVSKLVNEARRTLSGLSEEDVIKMGAYVAFSLQWLEEDFESEALQAIESTPLDVTTISVLDYDFDRNIPARDIASTIMNDIGPAEAFWLASSSLTPDHPLKWDERHMPLYGAVHALMKLERAMTHYLPTEELHVIDAIGLLSDTKVRLSLITGREQGLFSATYSTSKKASKAAKMSHAASNKLKEYIIGELHANPNKGKSKSQIAQNLIPKAKDYAKKNGIAFLKDTPDDHPAKRTIYGWVLQFYKSQEK